MLVVEHVTDEERWRNRGATSQMEGVTRREIENPRWRGMRELIEVGKTSRKRQAARISIRQARTINGRRAGEPVLGLIVDRGHDGKPLIVIEIGGRASVIDRKKTTGDGAGPIRVNDRRIEKAGEWSHRRA